MIATAPRKGFSQTSRRSRVESRQPAQGRATLRAGYRARCAGPQHSSVNEWIGDPMTTIADHSDGARSARRTSDRGALLAAIASPTNWRKWDAWRPAMRTAIKDADLPVSIRQWAMWLTDRLDRNGHADVGEIVALSCYCRRTTYAYLAQLEMAGIVHRDCTSRKIGHREWRKFATVSVATRIRAQAAPPLTCDSASARTTKRKPSSGSVGNQPPVRNARTRDDDTVINDEQRHALDEQWPLMARARSDLPGQRPGYSTNVTRDRWEIEGEFSKPWSPEPEPPPPRPVEPALVALIAEDPGKAMRQMLDGFGRLPADVESRQR